MRFRNYWQMLSQMKIKVTQQINEISKLHSKIETKKPTTVDDESTILIGNTYPTRTVAARLQLQVAEKFDYLVSWNLQSQSIFQKV